MRVEWLKTALKNIDDEAAYIALESPKAAADFVKAIFTSIEHLAQFPAIGREGRLPGTREWVLADRPYVIHYKIGRAHV